jgi:hypothetical protein
VTLLSLLLCCCVECPDCCTPAPAPVPEAAAAVGLPLVLPTLPLLLPTRRSLSNMLPLLLPAPPAALGEAAGAAVELLPLRPKGLRAPPGVDMRGLLPLAAAGAAWFVR